MSSWPSILGLTALCMVVAPPHIHAQARDDSPAAPPGPASQGPGGADAPGDAAAPGDPEVDRAPTAPPSPAALSSAPPPETQAPPKGAAGVDGTTSAAPGTAVTAEVHPQEADDAAHHPADDAPIASADAWADAWGDVAADQSSSPVYEARLYGFIDAYLEQVAKTPARDPDDPDRTVYESNPYEFDVLNLNVMLQGSIYGRYRFFLNLAAPGAGSAASDEPIGVRNAWVEAPIVAGYLNVRAGKTYRRFGLYNEILDAVPTFIGIEPPELFDRDHLMLTRTTNLMLFGAAELGEVTLNYAVTTGNEERTNNAIPFGLDVYADISDWLRVGTSFYTTGGDAAPTRGVGDGSPRGGVINWMETDRFVVYGGYAQVQHESGLIVQLEAWQADHRAKRDPAALTTLAAEGDLTRQQLNRFYEDGDPDGDPILDVEYLVRTAYLRLGYEIPTGDMSSITPYLQADYYDNPETIASKDLGGDNEAGITDNGVFTKYTIGAVIRPVTQVALKLDGSAHVQEFNGSTVFYPEARLSFSYLWGLQ